MQPLFQLGTTTVSLEAQDLLHPQDVHLGVRRHALGDWGELGDSERQENDIGLSFGLRVVSLFRDRWGQKFYVITEADRSATRVLLPTAY